jgi:hypothetical protein
MEIARTGGRRANGTAWAQGAKRPGTEISIKTIDFLEIVLG